MLRSLSLSEHRRFWKKVHKREDGCWEWIGTYNGKGVPQFYAQATRLSANRVAYYNAYHVDPEDQHVHHTCGNTRCVNAAHLTLGRPGQFKLTEAQVLELRRRYTPRGSGNRYTDFAESAAKLAKEFGVTPRTVLKAVYGDTWADI